MNGRLPVLMTASVSTRGMKGACFSDAEREQMYLETLCFYLETLPVDQPIVFAENSGWDLVEFQEKVRRRCEAEAENGGCTSRVEFISVDPAICDQSRGKGYNEILLVNQAIEKSVAIRAAGAFMKVTGRYPICNLPWFLKDAELFLSKGGQFYGDMKDHKIYDILFHDGGKKWNGHAMGTAIFASTGDFYREKLSGSYVDCNDYDGNFVEVVWHRLLIPHRHAQTFNFQPSTFNPVHLRFPVEPICGGLQGSVGETLVFSQSNESAKAKLARFVGNAIRRLLPWFWF